MRPQDDQNRRSSCVSFFRWLLPLLGLCFVSNFVWERKLLQSNDFNDAVALRTTSSKNENEIKESSSASASSFICEALLQQSTDSWWTRHSRDIHQASRLPDDVDYLRHDFTAELLALVSPRLSNAIHTTPRDYSIVRRILRKVEARYHYLTQNVLKEGDEPPPPIHIVVMGGSVTLGVRCKTGIPGHGDKDFRYCAWPHRLEALLNQLFGFPMVEVTNEAVGMTNSNIGNILLKYNLLPSLQTADIIIHAYSTNDFFYGEDAFQSLQDFVRQVMKPPEVCLHQDPEQLRPTPLLLQINDIVTPLHMGILARTRYSQIVQVLASYYGFTSLNYAAMVNDWGFGDPKETWFTIDEFPQGSYHFAYSSDIHPGQGMHVTTSWMVAYTLLHLTNHYCTWKDWWRNDDETNDHFWLQKSNVRDYDESMLSSILPLYHNGTDESTEGKKPRPSPLGLPPPLDDKLTPNTLSFQWKNASRASRIKRNRPCSRARRTCPFQWINGHDQTKDESWIRENIVSKIKGAWTLGDVADVRKAGLTPTSGQLGDAMTFPLQEDIQEVIVFYLKSYGEYWEKSQASIDILLKDGTTLASATLQGFHARQTSEMYVEELDISNATSSQLQLSATLISGKNFKIMGLVQCY
jgi:hypothetical protein